MLHACTSRGATCTAKQGRIVQTQNFIFGRLSNFFFYPNGTWTHPPTSKLFLDFWNLFNFAKPLNTLLFFFYPFQHNLINQSLSLQLIHCFFFPHPQIHDCQSFKFSVVHVSTPNEAILQISLFSFLVPCLIVCFFYLNVFLHNAIAIPSLSIPLFPLPG